MEQAYQVFNPLTGQHTRCESEQTAKELMLDFALQVVMTQKPTVAKEIVHENGDVTWEAVDFVSQVKVTL